MELNIKTEPHFRDAPTVCILDTDDSEVEVQEVKQRNRSNGSLS